MNNDEVQLNDIADDLFILNRNTIEVLVHLDNADECIALYVVYYRLAKWQKTNVIKATDEYIMKTLKWGKQKTIRSKKSLKENGLIEIIQKRDESRITGWFIKINYIISKNSISKIFTHQEVSYQEVLKSTSTKQNTIALNNKYNCLNKQIPPIYPPKGNGSMEYLFQLFWNEYPKHISKGTAEKWFIKNNPTKDLVEIMVNKLKQQKKTKQWKKESGKFIPYPSTWLNAKGWEDEINPDDIELTEEEENKLLEKMLEEEKRKGEYYDN